MKNFVLFLMSSALVVGAGVGYVHHYWPETGEPAPPVVGEVSQLEADVINAQHPPVLSPAERFQQALKKGPYLRKTVSGHYLSGRFAQRNHDWKAAEKNLSRIMDKTQSDDIDLLKRAMVLALGAGEYSKAMDMAQKVTALAGEEQGEAALANLFLGIEAFKKHDYGLAREKIDAMPEGSLSNFIMPLLKAWSAAGNGEYQVAELKRSVHHIYHAVLIADYLGKKEEIAPLLSRALQAPDLDVQQFERIADLYAHIGEREKAVELYQKLYDAAPMASIKDKIEGLKAGEERLFKDKIHLAEEGLARAMFDMARILAQDLNDDSARVFTHMALYLDPSLLDAKFMTAYLASRNGRAEDAIQIYKSITPEGNVERYLEAQRHSAELLEEAGKFDEAIALLEPLYDTHQNLDALIQIGDLYRRKENFSQAVAYYDRAEKALGKNVPADYWHLYYVRGMSYEQMKQWEKAESDLKKALEFEPDHPFVLNYLGYAWADQGVNLPKALEMIEKAASLEPSDGYIIDSLGWVLYRMGQYEEAVPHLEKAVELRPYDPVINDHLGDAYWRVGRKLEARFQWVRAKNHAEEENLKTALETKLLEGLPMVAATGAMVHADNTAAAANAAAVVVTPSTPPVRQ